MEATCNNCDHWENTQAKLNATLDSTKTEDFGVCNELSDHNMDPEYIIPVLNQGKPVTENGDRYDYITGANFGCNHFDARM